EASGADLSAEVEDTPDALVVRIVGPGHDLLLEEEGDVLRALEYLLQLTYRRAIEPRRLVVECEGFRAQRDESLKAEALRIAALVAADGKPRTTGVLNSYERRIVHMALTDHPQLETFSVGTEGGRRVTIAPRGTRGPGAEG
ncbi:MAG TPA: R3H domain-containing nucleic acid-binding protein, partial [Vicinamibacteria bacterium]|nr:R3H domain-containing nucleic acid-binding protein [Vicinamibacteria bacterium]